MHVIDDPALRDWLFALPGWRVTLYAPPKGTFTGFRKTLAVTLTVDDANIVTAVTVE